MELSSQARQRLRNLVDRKRHEDLARSIDSGETTRRYQLGKHEGIISETLAGLLVEQGHYLRAERMYRQLSLLIPEKKHIFAAIIETLQEKH